MRLILVNPNTTEATTAAMVGIAAAAAGKAAQIDGRTVTFGHPLITERESLKIAGDAVTALAPSLADSDGVIVAAFGDPGLAELRARLDCPVTGIAEAGMGEAGAQGRRFAVVTTTPGLVPDIDAAAARYGHAAFAGTWLTQGDTHRLMADPRLLLAALDHACRWAIAEGGIDALVIGGGPLAVAARALADTLPVPLIEPVPAAVRLALLRARAGAAP